jgi:hypothetical protein
MVFNKKQKAAGASNGPSAASDQPGRSYYDVLRSMTTDPEVREAADVAERETKAKADQGK